MTNIQKAPQRDCPMDNPADDGLLDHLVRGSLGPLSRLQETVERTIEQVSRWIDEPFNRHQITNLVTLLDAQTQLIICQQRLVAVSRMVDVAMNAPGHETVRRACADLLKIRLVDPYKDDKRPVRMPPAPPIDTEAVLEALEKLGEQSAREFAADDTKASPSSEVPVMSGPTGEPVARAARANPQVNTSRTMRSTAAVNPKTMNGDAARAKLSTSTAGKRVQKIVAAYVGTIDPAAPTPVSATQRPFSPHPNKILKKHAEKFPNSP